MRPTKQCMEDKRLERQSKAVTHIPRKQTICYVTSLLLFDLKRQNLPFFTFSFSFPSKFLFDLLSAFCAQYLHVTHLLNSSLIELHFPSLCIFSICHLKSWNKIKNIISTVNLWKLSNVFLIINLISFIILRKYSRIFIIKEMQLSKTSSINAKITIDE